MSRVEQPTRLYLLRHGQSTFNQSGLYQGCSDRPELTPQGHRQAHAAARRLAGLPLDTVYSSPLRRARETAAHVLTACGEPPAYAVVDDLREVDLPLWEGIAFADVRERFAADYALWKRRPQALRMRHRGRDIYPARDAVARAGTFLSTVRESHPGEQVLAVAHGGLIRALVCSAIGTGPERLHTLGQSNCGLSVIEIDASGTARVQSTNCTAHLDSAPQVHEAGGLRVWVCSGGRVNGSAEVMLPGAEPLVVGSGDIAGRCWRALERCNSSLNGTGNPGPARVRASRAVAKALLARVLGLRDLAALDVPETANHLLQFAAAPQPPVVLAIDSGCAPPATEAVA